MFWQSTARIWDDLLRVREWLIGDFLNKLNTATEIADDDYEPLHNAWKTLHEEKLRIDTEIFELSRAVPHEALENLHESLRVMQKSINARLSGNVDWHSVVKECETKYNESAKIFEEGLAEIKILVEDSIKRHPEIQAPQVYLPALQHVGGGVMINSPISQGDKSFVNTGKMDITGSTLNFGEISGNVKNSVHQIPDQLSDLKQLLLDLHEAVESDDILKIEDKADLLEQVKCLAETSKADDQKSKEGVARRAMKIFDATLRGLPDTAKIVESCAKIFPLVVKALGVVL